jgi:arsenate reductase
MTLTLHGIPNCDTVKKARTWLEGKGVAYDFRDYKKAPPSPEELAHWTAAVGWGPCSTRRARRSRSCRTPTRAASMWPRRSR